MRGGMAAPGVPAGAIGAMEPLPPPAPNTTPPRDWTANVRDVGSDAELREALLEAGPCTARGCADSLP